MRRNWRRGVLVGAVSIAAVVVPPLSPAVGAGGHPWRASGQPSPDTTVGSDQPADMCNGWPQGSFPGSLHITTVPPGAAVDEDRSPDPPAIAPGQKVDVTITWNAADFSGWSWVGLSNCVGSGQTDEHTLDKVWQPVPPRTTGTVTVETSFFVPNALDGALLCDSAWLWGSQAEPFPSWSTQSTQNGAGNGRPPPWNQLKLERSNPVCWLVGPAAQTPEIRLPVMLGASALVLMGGYVVVTRRRRISRASHPGDSSTATD